MICKVPDCRDDHYARGWCKRHYMRWWAGKPVADKPAAPYTTRTRPSYFRGGKGV